MEKRGRKFKKTTSVPKSPRKIAKVAESKVLEVKFNGRKIGSKLIRFVKNLKVDLNSKEGIN